VGSAGHGARIPEAARRTPVFDAGSGLTLRAVRPEDAEELFALTDANRASLREWLPWVDATRTPADTLAFIEAAMGQARGGGGFHAAIRSGSAIVGVVGYHEIDWQTRRASLGYWLAAAQRGRGVATDACRAMVNDAFGRLGLRQVTIACATDNLRSRAVPERLGFVPVRVVEAAEQLAHRTVDHVVYGLDHAAWLATGVDR